MNFGKKQDLVSGSSFTSSRRGDIGYYTIRFISTSEKLAEQRLIPGSGRKGSGADTKGNIREVWAMETMKKKRTQQLAFFAPPHYETASKSSLLKSDKGGAKLFKKINHMTQINAD